MSALPILVATRLAAACVPGVAPETLLAIASHESGLSPTVIHDNTSGDRIAPSTPFEAVAEARRRLALGHRIDVGLMQIALPQNAALLPSLVAAFEPCASMRAGAAVLRGGYAGGRTEAQQQSALRVALSRYNTGDARRGFQNGYVRRVEAAAAEIIPAIKVTTRPFADGQDMEGGAPAPTVDCPGTGIGWHVSTGCGTSGDETWHVRPESGEARRSAAATGAGPAVLLHGSINRNDPQ